MSVNLDGFSGTGVGTAASASQPGSHYRSYSQAEVDVRLGRPPIRDGSTLSAYARVLADGGDLRRAVPSQNAMLGVGLRWKPWRSQVIYLAAENQNGLADRSRRDVLLRASASFFGGGRASDDWHPSGNGWFSRNLYLDGARYLETRSSALTADYRTSYHRKMSASQTLEPYGHLQFNGMQATGSHATSAAERACAGTSGRVPRRTTRLRTSSRWASSSSRPSRHTWPTTTAYS